MRVLHHWIAVSCLTPLVLSGLDLGWRDDSDLTQFMSRPDIKAPVLDVKIYDKEAVIPGKWFVAPYTTIQQAPFPAKYYQACQSGPHIYDLNGDLIWSGACKFRNQNVHDFRVFEYQGSQFMSGVLHKYMGDKKGRAFVMNNHYQNIWENHAPELCTHFNMHELKIAERDGRLTAMYLTHRVQLDDVRELGLGDLEEGLVADTGLLEIDTGTGEILFEWWPSDEVPLTEGTTPTDRLRGPAPDGWNWFHANSIDKNSDGDYLISSRLTDAIYKISGEDGAVLWQLGGKSSDFVLEGWNFSRQHDAQWVSWDDHKEIISFLDNGGDTETRTSDTSSALFVELQKDSDPPIARVLQRIWRPDGQVTEARGNFQRFANSGNVLVGWSENSYMTEHDAAGNLLLEAEFHSERMVTYRSYKFNFTGEPIDPPDIKVVAYGESKATATTVAYVSWNGATEVVMWKFYSDLSGSVLGSKAKTGFESVFQKQGYYQSVYAEALDIDGKVLGRTTSYETCTLTDWVESASASNPAGHDADERMDELYEPPVQELRRRKTEL